jgi:hypothetical protein
VLGALAVLGLAVWKWPLIAGWLYRTGAPAPTSRIVATPEYSLTGEWLHRLGQAWNSQPSTLLFAAAAAFFTLMVFAAYVVWRED